MLKILLLNAADGLRTYTHLCESLPFYKLALRQPLQKYFQLHRGNFCILDALFYFFGPKCNTYALIRCYSVFIPFEKRDFQNSVMSCFFFFSLPYSDLSQVDSYIL